MKSCCFFGHKNTPYYIKERLSAKIEQLIIKDKVFNFYVGNHGNFDLLVYSALREMKEKYPYIHYSVVLAYPLSEKKKVENYCDSCTLYPDFLKRVPKEYAIVHRNNFMIQHSQYVICYIVHNYGNAVKFMEKAQQKNHKIINLFYP